MFGTKTGLSVVGIATQLLAKTTVAMALRIN